MRCVSCGGELATDEGYETIARCLNRRCALYNATVSFNNEKNKPKILKDLKYTSIHKYDDYKEGYDVCKSDLKKEAIKWIKYLNSLEGAEIYDEGYNDSGYNEYTDSPCGCDCGCGNEVAYFMNDFDTNEAPKISMK